MLVGIVTGRVIAQWVIKTVVVGVVHEALNEVRPVHHLKRGVKAIGPVHHVKKYTKVALGKDKQNRKPAEETQLALEF